MKKYLSLSALLLVSFLLGKAQTTTPAPAAPATATGTTSGFCNIHDMADSCKRVMKPFAYSAQNALHVALKSEPQVKDIEFPTYYGGKYRVIINTLSMPSGTEVDVYDRDPSRGRSQQLYSTKTQGVSNFDVDCRSGRIYVEYTIPAATATSLTGCSVVMFAFESNRDKE